MKARKILAVTAWILAALCAGQPAFAQKSAIEEQMDLVVKLRIHRAAQSTEETAAGLLVGKDQQTAYFITACHAVIQEDVRVASVELQFRGSPQKFKAKVFEKYEPVLDLAVVEVPLRDLPAGLTEIARKDATLTVPVHVIGHPTAGDWVVASGTVIGLNTNTGDIHHFTVSRDNSLAEGHSGGPVFDNQGAFLGMHTASAPTFGVEAKSAEIVEQLAAWQVPTNNITRFWDVSAPVGGGVKVVNQQADRDAISKVIDAYVDSFNRRDAKALWQIWPGAPSRTRSAIESYFQSARSISMKFTVGRIETNGTKGTVLGQSSQEFLPKQGSAQKAPESSVTIELEKQKDTWLITLIR
jgi:hypothetical protein